MKPIEKIKIPKIEPGTPSAVRKCTECKAPITVPLDFFNKLLECPFCHKGILLKSRRDQAKETLGCLGGCLFSLLALGALALLSIYIERPPWRYGWSPVVKLPKPNETATDTVALELPPRFRGAQFYYLGQFYRNFAYLLRFENGGFLAPLPGSRCEVCVLGVRESLMIVYYDPKTDRFAFDLDNGEFRNGRVRQLQFIAAPLDSLAAKARERASNPTKYLNDIKQGARSRWVYVEARAGEKQGDAYYVESALHLDAETGCEYFRLLTVSEDRMVLTIDGGAHRFRVQFNDVFGTPVGAPEERPMKNGDVASAIWRLYENRILE